MHSGVVLRLEEGIECLAPSALGPPEHSGFLWLRPKGGKAWTRRYCVAKANFLYWFAEKEAAAPSRAAGALCFEDLVFEWLEPPPPEREVAAYGAFAFVVRPEAAGRGKASDRRTVQLCAESEAEMQAWTRAVVMGKYEVVLEDRARLAEAREQVARLAAEARGAHEAAAAAERKAEASEGARRAAEEALREAHARVRALEAEAAAAREREAEEARARLAGERERSESKESEADEAEARPTLRRQGTSRLGEHKSARKLAKSGAPKKGNDEWEEKMVSDVDDETALALLARTQEVSQWFHGFARDELQTLARTLTVLEFAAGDLILQHGETASFFGLMLEGSLAPQVDGSVLSAQPRGIGEIIGEMSLFTGGIRGASMVALTAGSLAVYKFASLERLRHADEKLARKLSWQLARAALAKRLEGEGRRLEELEEREVVLQCSELLIKQAEQRWEAREESGGVAKESLLKKAKVKFGFGEGKARRAKKAAKLRAFGGAEEDDLQLDGEALALLPPDGPGHGDVWKEGVLRKRGEKWSGLQKRLFVLRSGALFYYDRDKTEEHKGKIPLVSILSLRLTRSAEGPQMELDVGTRVFQLVAADDVAAQSWRLAIEAAALACGCANAERSLKLRGRAKSRKSTVAAAVHSSHLDDHPPHIDALHAAHRSSHLAALPSHRPSHLDALPSHRPSHLDALHTVEEDGAPPGGTDPREELLLGWLQKQDHHKFSSKFKPRFWVLTRVTLDYYRNEARDEHLGSIPLVQVLEVVSAQERSLSKFEGEFHVVSSRRTYKLLAETHEVKRKWTKALTRAIKAIPKGAPPVEAMDSTRGLVSMASEAACGFDAAEVEEEHWSEQVQTEADVAAAVVRRVTAHFQLVAGMGPSGADVGTLLGVGDDVLEEMLRSADDFRFAEPPRRALDLFLCCVREFHSQLYANFAHLYRDVGALSPMDMLQLVAWLQEYRERLQAAEAPLLNPPLVPVQRALIEEYAKQSRATWCEWMVNLHKSDIEYLNEGRLEEDGGTPTPVDLLRMLNEPFSSIENLQVPALTNVLLAACGHVIRQFAELQKQHLRGLVSAALGAEAAKLDATLRLRAACGMMHNAERARALLEQLGSHLDASDEVLAAVDGRSKSLAALAEVERLGSEEQTASQALDDADMALGLVGAVAVGVLCGLSLYCGGQASPRPPLAEALAAAFGALGNSALWLRRHVAEAFVAKLERSLLKMLVAHVIEALLCGKANLLVDESCADAPAPAGLRVLQALLAFVQAALVNISQKAVSIEVSALQALLETANCRAENFASKFAEMCRQYPEVGLPHAEAMLARRTSMNKNESKELALHAVQQAGAENPSLPATEDNWPPAELLALAKAPFALATLRLAPKKAALKGLASAALGRLGR
ncbi:hypothetical protein AB1Y20_022773 [Prymnesium parvum]|uniref:Exocyst complex component Sec6 n=1 Tax=Prymnesium parvum TaxID=97485 RepID=A0AB34JI49_PRYPA